MAPFDTVREIIAATFGIPPERVTPQTRQADVPEWDSVGHLNLMLGLEQALGLQLEVEQMTKLTSVESIVQFVEAECGGGSK